MAKKPEPPPDKPPLPWLSPDKPAPFETPPGWRWALPLPIVGEELANLLRRIDRTLHTGEPLYNPKDPADRLELVRLRQQLVEQLRRDRGRGQGGKELPPEAHWAVAGLEQIYGAELQKPRAQRQTMAQIVAGYRPLMATLVTPAELLQLWKNTHKAQSRKARSEKV
jgi:hypothetical protein